MSDIASSDPAVRPVIPPGTAGSPGADIPGGDVPSVVIVDADDRTRASLVGLLGIRGRVRVLGDAAQAKAAVTLIRDCHPDVIVLDPRLPDLEGGLLAIRIDPDPRPPGPHPRDGSDRQRRARIRGGGRRRVRPQDLPPRRARRRRRALRHRAASRAAASGAHHGLVR